MLSRPALRIGVAAAAAAVLGGCGGHARREGTWPLPNHDLRGTRATGATLIDSSSVAKLVPRWRFGLTAKPSFSGIFASTPVADAGTIYVQDLRSNVYALARETGAVRWTRRYGAKNDGPNGLALADGRVYGATDSDAFALDARTGKQLWSRHLTSATEQFVDIAPVVWRGLVLTSTIGYPPRGRGALYALDARTGEVRWRFDTVARPWRFPFEAGGGGAWYPLSIDGRGRLYAGISNPDPWGGTPRRPNGGAFPGRALYTDSLLVLDARTGRLLWFDQVTPHDVRDYDFEATPVLAGPLAIGAGKAGRVVAWDRRTRQRRWMALVGLHRNDDGPLPRRRVTVCPGLLGGVETPLASADGRVFAPVVDLCGWGSAIARQEITELDPARGRGRLVALDARTGRTLWERRLPSPAFGCATVANDVVFTATYDGGVYAFRARDGRPLWHARMRAGINACPAVAGDLLLVGAGVRNRRGAVAELVAFGRRR